MRGRIIGLSNGQPLVGVRVSHEDHLEEGFTLSRPDGTFDYVCNCKGQVNLKFGRSPFPFVQKAFQAFLNEVQKMGEIFERG